MQAQHILTMQNPAGAMVHFQRRPGFFFIVLARIRSARLRFLAELLDIRSSE